MNLSVQEFLTAVLEWANANEADIRNVWPLNGGWEAWAQAEIAAYINAKAPSTYIEREARVYPGRTRADFLVNSPYANPPSSLIVVEMKCESLRNWGAFIEGLNTDLDKLNDDMVLGLDAAKKICLGIFFSPESEQQLYQLANFTIAYTNNKEIGVAAVSFG